MLACATTQNMYWSMYINLIAHLQVLAFSVHFSGHFMFIYAIKVVKLIFGRFLSIIKCLDQSVLN